MVSHCTECVKQMPVMESQYISVSLLFHPKLKPAKSESSSGEKGVPGWVIADIWKYESKENYAEVGIGKEAHVLVAFQKIWFSDKLF